MPLARLLLYQAEVQLSALRSTELATDDPGVLAAQPARGTGDPCTKGLAIQRRGDFPHFAMATTTWAHRTRELGGRHAGRYAARPPLFSTLIHVDITKKITITSFGTGHLDHALEVE